MIKMPDLVRLPYTPDLTQAGIDYAIRSLAFTYDRMGGSAFTRLRRIVAGKAVELAFRRCLDDQGISYDNLGVTPFTDPDRYDVSIGGRRCDLKSFQIFQRQTIEGLRHNPAELLRASALVPVDQLGGSQLNDDDLYIFAFCTALVTAHRAELALALQAGQPIYLIHALPGHWSRPKEWASLGQLALKLEADPALGVEIGGQDVRREFQIETAELTPGQRCVLQQDFYSLAYLRASAVPAERLGIHSPALGETYVAAAHEWGNIWVYGMRIFLVGYMTRGEFHRRAERLPANSRVWQYAHTRTDNYCLPVSELHPLADLFARARQWGQTPLGGG